MGTVLVSADKAIASARLTALIHASSQIERIEMRCLPAMLFCSSMLPTSVACQDCSLVCRLSALRYEFLCVQGTLKATKRKPTA